MSVGIQGEAHAERSPEERHTTENERRLVARVLLASGALLALGAPTESLGIARDFLGVLVAQACLLTAGAYGARSAFSRTAGSLRARALRPGLLLALALGSAAAIPMLPLAARPLPVAALAAGLGLRSILAQPLAPAVRAIAAGSVPFSAYLLLRDAPTFLHPVREQWARHLSLAASWVRGQHVELGPGPAGVDLIVLCALLLWTWPPRRVGAGRMLVQATGLAALQAAFVLVVPALLGIQARLLDPNGSLGLTAFDLGWVLALLLGLLLAAAHAVPELRPALAWSPTKRFFRPAVPVLGVAIVLGLALGSRPTAAAAASERALRVAIHDPGILDRRLPVMDELRGQLASGMFGFLRPFLELSGFEVEDADLEQADLARWDVLVVINLKDGFSPETLARLHAFVEGGGGLLLAGDHTGAEQIRAPSNAILGRWNLGLEFDSAVALRSSWADGMRFLLHPVTRSVVDETDVQIWTGASLAVSAPARPVVVGRGAFSDAGDLESEDGSNLGDFRHRHEERLGDVVLVAAAEPGRGRVLVFGDTSPLQTLALGESRPFVRDAVDWLAGRSSSGAGRWAARARTGALTLILVWGLLSWLRSPRAFALLGALLLLEAASVAPRRWDTPPLRPAQRPIAHIDLAHGENLTRVGWYPRGIAGLQQCLFRAGFWPFLPKVFDPALLGEASLLCVCAPTRDFARDERERLLAWMDAGGVLLLTAGMPEANRIGELCTALGVAVGATPLGPAESEHGGRRFRLQDAFPLTQLPAHARVAAEAFGRPVAAWIPRGSGGAFVVADSRFLANQNVEDFDSYVHENVLYVVSLLEELRESAR